MLGCDVVIRRCAKNSNNDRDTLILCMRQKISSGRSGELLKSGGCSQVVGGGVDKTTLARNVR